MHPLSHGPFLVDPCGGLTLQRTPALRFAWRGRGCEARIEAGRISLVAEAGRVPSTAGNVAARPGAFATLNRLPGELPEGWRVHLLPDHRIQVISHRRMPDVATATHLVGAMVRFALTLDPYLDRLEAAGIGTVKT